MGESGQGGSNGSHTGKSSSEFSKLGNTNPKISIAKLKSRSRWCVS